MKKLTGKRRRRRTRNTAMSCMCHTWLDSQRPQKELKPLQVGQAYKTGTTLFSRVCKLKLPRGIDGQKVVVYQIPCKSCTAYCIGEKAQTFGSKGYQHKHDIKTKKKKNGIGDHMREHKKHYIDWDSRKYIEIEKRLDKKKHQRSSIHWQHQSGGRN